MDIALSVEHIYPDAKFASSTTYAELQRTWCDARPIPTETELADAWVAVLAARAAQEGRDAVVAGQLALLRDEVERDKLTTDNRLDMLIEVFLATLARS